MSGIIALVGTAITMAITSELVLIYVQFRAQDKH